MESKETGEKEQIINPDLLNYSVWRPETNLEMFQYTSHYVSEQLVCQLKTFPKIRNLFYIHFNLKFALHYVGFSVFPLTN